MTEVDTRESTDGRVSLVLVDGVPFVMVAGTFGNYTLKPDNREQAVEMFKHTYAFEPKAGDVDWTDPRD